MNNERLMNPWGVPVSAHVMDVADMIDAGIAAHPELERHQLVAHVTTSVLQQLDQHQRFELVMLKLHELMAPKMEQQP